MIITLTMYHADSNQGYIDHDDNDHNKITKGCLSGPIKCPESKPSPPLQVPILMIMCKFHNYNHLDENANDDDLLQL